MDLRHYWESKRQAKIEAEVEKRRIALRPLVCLDNSEQASYSKIIKILLDDNFCPECETEKELCHLHSDYNCLKCWVTFLNSEYGLATLKAFTIDKNGRKMGVK